MAKKAPSLKCPRCEEIDAVYKVSALYEHGFSTETYQRLIPPPPKTNWAPLLKTEERVVQSTLSKKLSPPRRPEMPGGFSRNDPVYKLIPSEVKIVIWLIIIGAFILPYLLSSNDSGFGCFFTLSMVVALILYFIIRNPYVAIAQREFEEKELKPWKQAMEKWGQIYYCARDDIVFNPDDGSFVAANEMNQYIHR